MGGPSFGPSLEHMSVVKSVGLALPEFDSHRKYAVASPKRREGHILIGKSLVNFVHALFEGLTILQLRALAGGPGADLTATRAFAEVNRRFRGVQCGDRSLNANLPFQALPVDYHSGARVGFKFSRLAACVIRKEYKASVVHSLKQHGTG